MIKELLSYYCNKRDIPIPNQEQELKDAFCVMQLLGLLTHSKGEVKQYMMNKGFNYEDSDNK